MAYDWQKPWKCCLCGRRTLGFGNNPEPIASATERCCDDCNKILVIPTRIHLMQKKWQGDQE